MPSPNWVEQLVTTWSAAEALVTTQAWAEWTVTPGGLFEFFVGAQPGVSGFALFGMPIPVSGGMNYLGSMTWTEVAVD